MADQQMQIGEVAERTGLSLRTIRHYEEVGLLAPSARSKGGFRLYTETDIMRLMTIRRMKPLNFSLEEARELLDILDALQKTGTTGEDRQQLRGRLDTYRQVTDARCEALRARLEMAEHFAASLHQKPPTRD
ncbi:MerR family transcriptional regulator [Streptomyces rubiginosohelvolus]|uniref:MerR family transcriptional regulator n=1 Tax=Streptomyces rubiginosohelvolus TaxID=67362 RepID=UPI0036B737D3